jgi:hypothetical protein
VRERWREGEMEGGRDGGREELKWGPNNACFIKQGKLTIHYYAFHHCYD